MTRTREESLVTTLEVTVVLTDQQYLSLREMAGEEEPPLATSDVVRRLVDQATLARHAATQRRAAQLEIYDASGYAEHHPDYPDRPEGSADV